MRRLSLLIALFVVALLGLSAVLSSPGSSAQDASPAAMDEHPLVGTWLADTDTQDPEDPPELVIASADGGWVEVDADGGVALGRWESTGANTANLTLWALGSEEEGFGGTFIVRAMIEVAADGQSLTAAYTVEVIDPDGTATGEYGPGTASATRLAVEPMGTPVGSFEDLFAEFGEEFEEATPAASPAP
jgi:hypothetical protein